MGCRPGGVFLLICCCVAPAQVVTVRPASPVSMPSAIVDGNSPGIWVDGVLNVYTSTGYPLRMSGSGLFDLWMAAPPVVTPFTHYPLWIESAWKDEDGTIYGWYHHEARVCGDKLAFPEIGALVSHDGGQTFEDLGIVLASGDPVNCGAQNGFFAGGHGDFSVIPDRDHGFFYFFFTNYGGSVRDQGISIARMAFEDRVNPVGNVWKFRDGEWHSPGVNGTMTPIFPARVAWEKSNADSFWGAAVHWNTAIEQYVMVLNHACCATNWPQEGIYISFNADLSDPTGWKSPLRILDDSEIGFSPGYYPQVWGTNPGETDTIAGQFARLFVKGHSNWELQFAMENESDPPPPDPTPVCPDPQTARDEQDPCEVSRTPRNTTRPARINPAASSSRP